MITEPHPFLGLGFDVGLLGARLDAAAGRIVGIVGAPAISILVTLHGLRDEGVGRNDCFGGDIFDAQYGFLAWVRDRWGFTSCGI